MFLHINSIRNKSFLFACSLASAAILAAPVQAEYVDPKVQSVMQQIAEIPTGIELTKEHRDMITMIDEQYQALTSAQKVHVTTIDNLLIAEEELGLGLSAQHPGDEGGNMDPNSDNTAEATNYVFSTSAEVDSAVVNIRFSSDRDRDGVPDIPQNIVLTNPRKDVTNLTMKTTHMQDDTMDLVLEWSDNGVEIRLSQAEEGQWQLNTDIPVTFSISAYNGQKVEIENTTDIDPIDNTDDDSLSAEDLMKLGVLAFGLLLIIAIPIVLLIVLTKKKKPEEPKSRTDGVDERLRPLSEEEEIAQMKDQYKRDRMLMEKREEAERREQESRKGKRDDDTGKVYVSQEDIDNDETIEEYTEGETDLLNKKQKQKLEKRKNAFEDNDFFDDHKFD